MTWSSGPAPAGRADPRGERGTGAPPGPVVVGDGRGHGQGHAEQVRLELIVQAQRARDIPAVDHVVDEVEADGQRGRERRRRVDLGQREIPVQHAVGGEGGLAPGRPRRRTRPPGRPRAGGDARPPGRRRSRRPRRRSRRAARPCGPAAGPGSSPRTGWAGPGRRARPAPSRPRWPGRRERPGPRCRRRARTSRPISPKSVMGCTSAYDKRLHIVCSSTINRPGCYPPSTMSGTPGPGPAGEAAPRRDLAAMVVPLARALVAAEEPVLRAHQVSMWGYVVLNALAEQPVRTPSIRTQAALAQSIGADKSRIIGVLDELQQRGLIERRPDPADRRVHLLALTEAGRRLRESVRDGHPAPGGRAGAGGAARGGPGGVHPGPADPVRAAAGGHLGLAAGPGRRRAGQAAGPGRRRGAGQAAGPAPAAAGAGPCGPAARPGRAAARPGLR